MLNFISLKQAQGLVASFVCCFMLHFIVSNRLLLVLQWMPLPRPGSRLFVFNVVFCTSLFLTGIFWGDWSQGLVASCVCFCYCMLHFIVSNRLLLALQWMPLPRPGSRLFVFNVVCCTSLFLTGIFWRDWSQGLVAILNLKQIELCSKQTLRSCRPTLLCPPALLRSRLLLQKSLSHPRQMVSTFLWIFVLQGRLFYYLFLSKKNDRTQHTKTSWCQETSSAPSASSASSSSARPDDDPSVRLPSCFKFKFESKLNVMQWLAQAPRPKRSLPPVPPFEAEVQHFFTILHVEHVCKQQTQTCFMSGHCGIFEKRKHDGAWAARATARASWGQLWKIFLFFKLHFSNISSIWPGGRWKDKESWKETQEGGQEKRAKKAKNSVAVCPSAYEPFWSLMSNDQQWRKKKERRMWGTSHERPVILIAALIWIELTCLTSNMRGSQSFGQHGATLTTSERLEKKYFCKLLLQRHDWTQVWCKLNESGC